MSKFTHLHVHSHYSLLDGLPKIPDLIAYVKSLEQEALAITDHGTLYGAVEFYKEAKAQNIKPIIGVEAYLAPRGLKDKQAKIDDRVSHLILLAKDQTGYKNLLQLISLAHLEGFYYKPRIDLKVLREHSEGLIILSGCLKGAVPQALLQNDTKRAKELVQHLASLVKPGDFYLEIQPHPELAEQIKVNQLLKQLSQEVGLPLVATNDVHYLKLEDNEAQDILVCIQTGRRVNETDRLDMRGIDNSLKSEQQMIAALPDFVEAVYQTQEIVTKIDLELTLGKRYFPTYPTPRGETPEAYLRLLTEEGLTKHYTSGVEEQIRERLEYELQIIMGKGYASYFLVVADFVNWARQHDIIATTRGSAAGSLVSYLIGITTINPLEYRLPFERFLNPQRPSPPDIDMDFADNRRDEVISYVTAKYGSNRVAQIVTFGTMMARAAVRDVGRALGYPYNQCDRLAKMIPFGHQGFPMTIERAMKENQELKNLYDEDPEVTRLLTLAQKVEGCVRHASVHAAGMVIAPTPLTDYLPLQLDVDGQHIITQFDMGSCEDVGLVKMDFLGIRNLSILGSAVEIINKIKGIKIDLEKIPLNDEKSYALLSAGNTMGVFQLSSSGMTKYLTELRPNSIFDIMAIVALYRPGPINSIPDFIQRKHNPKLIKYLDDRLQDILNSSYGIITYQDDVLLIAIALAGYTWEEADKLRKAIGKKIPKEMARQKEKFISGCITNGLSEKKAITLWQLIEPFAAYGFNKSHAASYAIVAYQTAYLKANYPVEFMAALMTAESDDLEKISAAVTECEKMNIQVLPPDINQSLTNFTVVTDREIRFGLNAIKNLGEQVAMTIITERKEHGPYTSLEDFLQRTARREVTKKSLESLIKAGTLDSLHNNRRQLLDSIDTLTSYARDKQHLSNSLQHSLFNQDSNLLSPKLILEPAPPTSREDKLVWEKEVLGLYVTEHPFGEIIKQLDKYFIAASQITKIPDGKIIITGGIINQIKQITTKKGDPMAFVTLEDITGSQEVVVFPDIFKNNRACWQEDNLILTKSKVSHRNGEIKAIIEKVILIEDTEKINYYLSQLNNNRQILSAPVKLTDKKIINLTAKIDNQLMAELKKILLSSPGETTIAFLVPTSSGFKQIITPYKIKITPEIEDQIQKIINPI